MNKEISKEEKLAEAYDDWDKLKVNKHVHSIVNAFIAGEEVKFEFTYVGWSIIKPSQISLSTIINKPLKFRIKQEAKYVPYTFEDSKLFRDKWFNYNNSNIYFKVVSYWDIGVEINGLKLYYKEFFDTCYHEDNTPAGKLVE